jgi:hypothetical protein
MNDPKRTARPRLSWAESDSDEVAGKVIGRLVVFLVVLKPTHSPDRLPRTQVTR